MNPSPQYAALIGLDWADQKHDVCLLVPGQSAPETLTLANTPEAIRDWLAQLRQRFGGRPIALALEKTRSGLVHLLMQYDFIVMYPLNAAAVARYRQAFATSRAKDDPTDADGLIINNPFLDDTHEEIAVRLTKTSDATYPNDDYLVRTFQEHHAASDIAGYGKRVKSLRRDFALCSLGRAKELSPRLTARRRGDRVSELFHDRLSTAGRALLLRVLRNRI